MFKSTDKAKSLLERMNALETYPPFNQRDTNESSSSDAYSHVKGYTKGRACGTLSQYEWEAVCECETIIDLNKTLSNLNSNLFQRCIWYSLSKR